MSKRGEWMNHPKKISVCVYAWRKLADEDKCLINFLLNIYSTCLVHIRPFDKSSNQVTLSCPLIVNGEEEKEEKISLFPNDVFLRMTKELWLNKHKSPVNERRGFSSSFFFLLLLVRLEIKCRLNQLLMLVIGQKKRKKTEDDYCFVFIDVNYRWMKVKMTSLPRINGCLDVFSYYFSFSFCSFTWKDVYHRMIENEKFKRRSIIITCFWSSLIQWLMCWFP